jgi:serine/threonine protein kinase
MLGKYRVVGHIASGAMGAVYRAQDPDSGQEVALKVLLPELIAGKPAALERFRREAQLGQRLRHENIVSLYKFDEHGGCHFLVMEMVDGHNLLEHITRHGRLDPAESRLLLTQVAQALDHAHRQGLVHRDVKPANVLLTQKDGQVLAKLADFGLARETREADFRLTREGSTVGTVDYMAPEQARNSSAADIRSDIYSLGCTLFHMLAGVPPFNEGTLTERIYKHADTEPPDVRTYNSEVPPELVAMLRRMLAKKPRDRYQTPEELLNDLRPRPQPAPRDQPEQRRPSPKPRPAAARSVPVETNTPALGMPTKASPDSVPAASSANVRIAAGQFEWAREQLFRGNRDYGVQLLLTCCRLDPTNLDYHRAVRLAQKGRRTRPAGWLRWLRNLSAWIRFKLACRAGDPRRVLGLGEEMLVRSPRDSNTHMAMAAAAQELGAGDLALWLLLQAREQDGRNHVVHRALARLYEGRNAYEEAMASWEKVIRAVPGDSEALGRLRDLAALRTLEQNRQRQLAEKGRPPGAEH